MTSPDAPVVTRDLGPSTSVDVIDIRIPLAGCRLLDVGCGDLTFTRQLAARGATVIGVDPDPAQAARNRAAAPDDVTFIEAGATDIPIDDASVDGVFFSFSLHHVPAALYPGVFDEVRRVLRPHGYLCVIEPVDGPLNQVMRLFHDEDEVRAAAQQALHSIAAPMFQTQERYRYSSAVTFESFDDYATKYGGKSFNPDYTEADVRRPEVEAAFERWGAPDYRFESPKLMVLLRDLRL